MVVWVSSNVLICNRVGILVCKWLFQLVHDTNAVSAFDCILPLMVCSSAPSYGLS